jgi:hypothetical protein
MRAMRALYSEDIIIIFLYGAHILLYMRYFIDVITYISITCHYYYYAIITHIIIAMPLLYYTLLTFYHWRIE